MTLSPQGFLSVSGPVSCLYEMFPIFGAAIRTQILGNFLRNIAPRAALHSFLLRKLFQDRKPQVSSWFPVWFPNGEGNA